MKQYANAPPLTIDGGVNYRAVIATEQGQFEVDLLEDEAPGAVNNFVFLARDGFYNGQRFFRVILDFIAQAGDPTGVGTNGPGYFLEPEESVSPLKRGLLAVALDNRRDELSGSQFFIVLADDLELDDGEYIAFGRVVEGFEVLDSLTPRDPQADPNAPPGDRILSVEIIEADR